MCGHEYVWLDLIDRLIDHHHGYRIRFIKRLRANQALIISFISSFMLNFLCLRVFDYFSTLFRQTEWTKTLDPRSSEPGAEKEFISNFCLRPHLLIWYNSVHHVPKIVTPELTILCLHCKILPSQYYDKIWNFYKRLFSEIGTLP